MPCILNALKALTRYDAVLSHLLVTAFQYFRENSPTEMVEYVLDMGRATNSMPKTAHRAHNRCAGENTMIQDRCYNCHRIILVSSLRVRTLFGDRSSEHFV